MTREMAVLNAAVIGASGYTGAELLRILWGHPGIEVTVATANQYAGQLVGSLYPSLAMQYPGSFFPYEPGLLEGCDIVFCGLPHGESMEVVAEAARAGKKVVDLSADFRLTAGDYSKWYGAAHTSPDILAQAVYGLPELHRGAISNASVVANPGCYPTAALLGLAPLARDGLIQGPVIIDAKSGVSGAGRKATPGTHYTQVADGMTPYAVGVHRHTPEMTGELEKLAGTAHDIIFTPHLAPMNRGILATMYVTLDPGIRYDEVRSIYRSAYADEPFVLVLEQGSYPETKAVQGSNSCHIALEQSGAGGVLVVMSAIDNLVKGASGQAVQNANIILGLEESEGLLGPGLFP
jgi:N-acetyl-gamma-glutamyl-phosphate reductase